MTTFDRDKEVWTFKYRIPLVTYVTVDTGLDEAEARQKAEKAIVDNLTTEIHDMDVSDADWPINPTVTLRDPDEIKVKDLEIL